MGKPEGFTTSFRQPIYLFNAGILADKIIWLNLRN